MSNTNNDKYGVIHEKKENVESINKTQFCLKMTFGNFY